MVNAAKIVPLWAFCLLGNAHFINAATLQLQPETLKGWENYLDQAQAKFNSRLQASNRFLWLDEDPKRPSRLRHGQIEVAPIRGRGFDRIPNGLVHDWIGAMFIPNASIDEVVSLLSDYDRYKAIFHPEVIDAKLLAHSTEGDEFSLKLVNTVLFTRAGVDMQCLGRSVRLDHNRAYSTSYTTRVNEIRNYGRPDERELAPDTGDGFVWRLYSTTRFEQRDGGVYLETETIALTRDIPSSLKFLVVPVVKRLSRNSLALSLQKTRDAVHSTANTANQPSVSYRPTSNVKTEPAKSSFRQP
jgi:hypothetical protein